MTERTITTVRRFLFITLALGLAGTLAELLLLGHYEDWKQYLPLAVLTFGLLTQGFFLVSHSRGSVQLVQAASGLAIASGALGVIMHYRGNMEFALELTPELAGWALFKEVIMGATPALAPGALVPLGLMGLIWAYRHPDAGPDIREI